MSLPFRADVRGTVASPSFAGEKIRHLSVTLSHSSCIRPPKVFWEGRSFPLKVFLIFFSKNKRLPKSGEIESQPSVNSDTRGSGYMGDHMTQKPRGQGSKLCPVDRWGLCLCCVSSRTNSTLPSSQGEGGGMEGDWGPPGWQIYMGKSMETGETTGWKLRYER